MTSGLYDICLHCCVMFNIGARPGQRGLGSVPRSHCTGCGRLMIRRYLQDDET